jgi:hypothetical protein
MRYFMLSAGDVYCKRGRAPEGFRTAVPYVTCGVCERPNGHRLLGRPDLCLRGEDEPQGFDDRRLLSARQMAELAARSETLLPAMGIGPYRGSLPFEKWPVKSYWLTLGHLGIDRDLALTLPVRIEFMNVELRSAKGRDFNMAWPLVPFVPVTESCRRRSNGFCNVCQAPGRLPEVPEVLASDLGDGHLFASIHYGGMFASEVFVDWLRSCGLQRDVTIHPIDVV